MRLTLFAVLYSFAVYSQPLWTFDSGGSDVLTSLTLPSHYPCQIVVATAAEQNLKCLNGENGKEVWSLASSQYTGLGSSYGDENLIIGQDVNGDGFNDIVWGTAWGSESVFMIDSVTGLPIWIWDQAHASFTPKTGWINDLSMAHDYTADGFPDVVVSVGREATALYVIDGKSGQPLFGVGPFFDGVQENLSVNDIDGDGQADLIGGMGGSDGRVIAFSGKFAEGIWSYQTNATVWQMKQSDDIDGDSIPEVLLGSWRGNVTALSGASGVPLFDFKSEIMIFKLLNSADLNGDSRNDIVISGQSDSVIGINGLTGEKLWETKIDGVSSLWAADMISDVNQDGVKDFAFGSFTGEVFFVSGSDGKLIKRVKVGDSKIATLRATFDLDKDGFADLLVGTKKQNEDATAGKLIAISGKP